MISYIYLCCCRVGISRESSLLSFSLKRLFLIISLYLFSSICIWFKNWIFLSLNISSSYSDSKLKLLYNPNFKKNASSISHSSTVSPNSVAYKNAISFSARSCKDWKREEPKSNLFPCSSDSLWLNLIMVPFLKNSI